MIGVKYYRMRRGLSREKLSKITGISIPTLGTMEKANEPGSICALSYRKVADCLNVPIDELIRNDLPDSGDGINKRAPYPSRTENLNNYISIYRKANMLTFEKLALRLGITTRERARQVCSVEIAMSKHVEALARYENISTIEFIQKYSLKEHSCNEV